ncbi:hypothetical protein HpHA188_04940 [Helicobacter pylori]
MFLLTYADLFAGIGGFRLALDSLGLKCVFSAENNPHAIAMYKANFNDDSTCDITILNPNTMPNFDILCAGFPCQAFSVCGKQKGFEDTTRGTLFFDICRILENKKPKIFILENVKNLLKHNKGNTLFVMLQALSNLGYSVSYKILNAKDFSVPQNRERIIIVGYLGSQVFDFNPIKKNPIISMQNFLDKSGYFEILKPHEYTLLDSQLLKRQNSGLIFCGYRNKKIRTKGTRENTEHLSRVHKQPNRIYHAGGIHPTLASQEQSGRYFIYINNLVRKLTINECFSFMGFPKDFKKIGTNSQLYERIGNSICVPMVKAIIKEVLNQFYKQPLKENNMQNKTLEFLEKIYKECVSLKNLDSLGLSEIQLQKTQTIVEKEETFKGVYTVLITSLVYKSNYPSQDIRFHQANMDSGYSGRSFDTKFITPFLKQKQFLGAMKESGWLTRSLEQNLPYTLDYPGKISNIAVKKAFLEILDDIEKNPNLSILYLKALFYLSIREKTKKAIILVKPTMKESSYTIDFIINTLQKHFNFTYKSRGASILPVVALFSLYECLILELERFTNKSLKPLDSHYSCDKSSGNAGDIVILDEQKQLFEVIEIKFNIAIDSIILQDSYKKIAQTPIKRYYILSTLPIQNKAELQKITDKIEHEHGCQVIVNGIYDTLRYYLRLIKNTENFINNYLKNISQNTEINEEHKLAWNSVIDLNK